MNLAPDARRAALLVAGCMCVIPFLQPRHSSPIGVFYDEWLAFAFGLAAIALAAAQKRRALSVPALAVFLGLFALVLSARALFAPSAYPQSAFMWGLYAFFAACVVILGRDLADHFGRQRVCDLLAAALLAGAVANSIAGMLQVAGIPPRLDPYISHLHGTRAIGNVGQANLYANYLALGEASLIYLFARGRLSGVAAAGCGTLLVVGAGLAASRSYLIFLGIFALLAYATAHRNEAADVRRLARAAFAIVTGAICAQWLVPIGIDALGIQNSHGFSRQSAGADPGILQDAAANLRLVAWRLAMRLFVSAPWIGVGPEEFAGAAFSTGLPRELAGGELWTSPHNMVLQLLAETGLPAALLVTTGLLAWLRTSAGEFLQTRDVAMWWVLACVGVELVHALLEYPLWYAHFLAVTALVMGVGARGNPFPGQGALRAGLAGSALAGAVMLGIHLAEYVRFDLASPVAAGRSLAPDPEVARDRQSLAQLSRGLLASRAELWLFQAFPLDSADLERKVAVGNRVMRFWPSRNVIMRQSIFLALSGRDREATTLLAHGIQTYGLPTKSMSATLSAAPHGAQQVLRPLTRNTGM